MHRRAIKHTDVHQDTSFFLIRDFDNQDHDLRCSYQWENNLSEVMIDSFLRKN